MTALLDTAKTPLYKPPPRRGAAGLLLAWVVGGWAWTGTAKADVVDGVQLPSGAEKVGENRYRVPEDFEATLKYYRSVYPAGQYPRKSIVNQPGVKAVHIANPSRRKFEGINIYEANGEVRVYLLLVAEKPAPKKPAAKGGKGSKK